MSFKKCEKLSAIMIEKTAPSAVRRFWTLRVSLRSADTLVLIIPFLRDPRRRRDQPRSRLPELWREFALLLPAFAPWQTFSWASPCSREGVCELAKRQSQA